MADRTSFSFVLTAKEKTLAHIEEKYKDYKTVPGEKESVECYYRFEDKSSIKVFKNKEGENTVLLEGREKDYQELREMDLRLNSHPVERLKTDSPCISDLNFNHKVIGSDEAGNGETFKTIVITAAYVDAEKEVKRFIKMGVDDSKRIPGKVASIGKEVTGIRCWEEIKDQTFLATDRFVTRIITNEEYNRRRYGNGENKNDILKEAYLQVLGEAYKRNPGSRIVVDDFLDGRERETHAFKEELCSGEFSPDLSHVFMTIKADFTIIAVSLASVISSYICNLYFEHTQEMLDQIYKKDPEEKIELSKGNLSPDELQEFLSKLKPERREEFLDKYAKYFKNVKNTIKKMQ